MEFLDILHIINNSEINGFKTVKHTKPTAKIFNGNSYHPTHVFRGIILSEANRLKKLNEKTKDYEKALINLKIKALDQVLVKN